MDTSAIIGLVVVLTVMIGGLLAYRGLQRMVYPFREHMAEQGAALLRSGTLNRREADVIRRCLDDALSFSAGWLPVQAVWMALVGHPRSQSARVGEGRGPVVRGDLVHGVVARFLASVLAVNPIALLAFVPLMVVLMIAHREQPRPAIRETTATLPMTQGFCAL